MLQRSTLLCTKQVDYQSKMKDTAPKSISNSSAETQTNLAVFLEQAESGEKKSSDYNIFQHLTVECRALGLLLLLACNVKRPAPNVTS